MAFDQFQATTGISERDYRAIREFLLQSTVPLIYESTEIVGIQGSGCFFDLDGHLFFVTAGHVLKGVDPTAFGVPLRPRGGEVFTFGVGEVGWSRDDAYDVAAYRIDDARACKSIRGSYVILGESNLSPLDADLERYVVVGYPASTVTCKGDTLTTPDLTQIHTSRYLGDVDGERGPQDFFLKLAREGLGLWGQEKPVPWLPGISGGPVWQVRSASPEIWTPESVLSLVGIQVSCDKRGERYMRALRWEVVLAALRLLVPKVEVTGSE